MGDWKGEHLDLKLPMVLIKKNQLVNFLENAFWCSLCSGN